jgi:hypothetical protein
MSDQQLSLELTAQQTLEYPDRYRGHRLIARQDYTTHADRLGTYRALTWQCWAYGHSHADGRILAIGWRKPEEAIAAAMQYLDIFIGKVHSDHRHAECYDDAYQRVIKRLA